MRGFALSCITAACLVLSAEAQTASNSTAPVGPTIIPINLGSAKGYQAKSSANATAVLTISPKLGSLAVSQVVSYPKR